MGWLAFFGPATAQELMVPEGYVVEDGYVIEDGFTGHQAASCLHPCGPNWFPNFGGWPPIYTRVEYLGWWTEGVEGIPLVTTSVPTPASSTNAGAIGQPGTSMLLGSATDNELRPGVRVELGVWLNPCRTAGIEAVYAGLGEWNTQFLADQSTHAVLARPYTSSTGALESHLIAFPGVLNGSVAVDATTRFDSVEFLYRRIFRPDAALHWDFLIGYRHSRLDDSLTIAESLTSLSTAGGQPVGTTTELSDSFSAENRFHGAELGLVSYSRCGRLGMELSSRIALGDSRTQIAIAGTRTVTTNGVPTTSPNGLLAQPTNSNVYESSGFAVIPELGINLTYNVTNHTSLIIGYRAVYWSTVGRAADQIDPVLNLTQVSPGTLTGLERPDFQFIKSGFWAQGVTAGVDIRF